MPKDRNHKISCNSFNSEIEVTLEVLGGKWKALILKNLHENGSVHYNEFRKLIPRITQKMLSQQLKKLEEDGLVSRTVYPNNPPMVEYRLTETGASLIPIMKEMERWGRRFIDDFRARQESLET